MSTYLIIHVHKSSLSIFCNVEAPTELYTLSLHDALPIFAQLLEVGDSLVRRPHVWLGHNLQQRGPGPVQVHVGRSEEHTSELQSLTNLVCRLLLEKKKNEN